MAPLLSPLMLSACVGYNFDPPDLPPHDQLYDVADAGQAPLVRAGRHAALMRTPFLCLDTQTGRAEACPDDRPEDPRLSCDAAGCHGDFDYAPGSDRSTRHLRGSDGPSCYSCHTDVWSSRQE